MKVASVIIAAHNAEKYIEETITSVLAQTYSKVDCIVVDDGSTDNTKNIVNTFGTRIKYIYQDNAERSVARNTGLAHSIGQYVMFLDADDYITPDKIADQVTYLENHTDDDAVYSQARYFKDNGRRSYYTVPRITPEGDILDKLIYGNFINLGSPLIRKEALDRVNGFDIDREIILNEDWDLWLRLALSGVRYGFIDKVHFYYRVHSGNTSKQSRMPSIKSKNRVTTKIIEQYHALLEQKGIDCLRVLASVNAEYGSRLILEGEVQEGRKLLLNACKTDIPHRRSFQLFLLMSRVLGYRRLAALQNFFQKEL